MNTDSEIEQAYVDAAFERVTRGIQNRIARRRHRIVASVAGAAVLLSGASVAAATVWPNAQEQPYIACFQTDSTSSPSGLAVGFDMRDPVGYCIDGYEYRANPSDPIANWSKKSRSDLMACRLADGVAGVFPATSGGCESINLTVWTPTDAQAAAQLQIKYDEWSKATYGIPSPPIATTPHQVFGP